MAEDSTDGGHMSETSIQEKLASIATTANFIKEEQAAIRRNQHDLANRLQPLMILPERMGDMKDQHAELKVTMAALAVKVEALISLTSDVAKVKEDLNKIQPVINGLVADNNKGRGAIWATGALGVLVGALMSALAWLGFVHRG